VRHELADDNVLILVVDDEPEHADGIVEALERYSSNVMAVYSGRDALEIIRKQQVGIVITDLNLGGDIDGLAVLDESLKRDPDCAVILITAYASIDTCKDAIRQGAVDYLVKPIDIDQLRSLVEQLSKKISSFRDKSIASSAKRFSQDDGQQFKYQGVYGQSPAMVGIFNVLKRVSPTNISVLIEGKSGTGKELLARAIHENSLRKNKPFRPLNCAGLTASLLESELFGHSKGAFTGAAGERKGLFEIADKGTLFLDEIGDMPLNMQAKLLRVLEDGIVVPVGSNKQVVVDVRVISATNHDLRKLIDEKKFRQDLYFRIKGVSISLPSLKDRADDIPELCDYFIKEAAGEIGSTVKGISKAALEIFRHYDWPGNIRQLRNCIRTMVVMCETDMLDVKDIPPEVHQLRQLSGAGNTTELAGLSLNELEKQAIIETLSKTDNNREKAAKILGIGERTLYRKIKEYGL
jgi:two-component system response regulator HydG